MKLLFQKIWRWAHLMIAIRCHRLAFLVQPWGYLIFLHDTGYAPLRNNLAVSPQVLMDPL